MTTATETKTFSPGDRVYYSNPDNPGRITAVAGGKATVQVDDGQVVTVPVDGLTPLPAPQREWQVGDRLRGEHPRTGETITGIRQKQGFKYITVQTPAGTSPILDETAEVLTPVEAVEVRPCPFTEGDLLKFNGLRWEAGKIQQTPLLTWRVELIDPDPGVNWRPEYLEWPCEEPCPATAVASVNNTNPVNETPPESLTAAKHTPGFLSPNLADRLLKFSQGLDWQQNQFRIYGKEMPLPRLEIMFGDPGCTYRYGNVTLSPLPWPPELQALREQVEAATGHSYQVVIGNFYRTGADHIGYHADDSPEMGDNPAIASISLGATRRFDVRNEATREVTSYDLASGDLVFMPAGFQSTHKHRIAKTTKDVGLRINWTFRPHIGGTAPAVATEIVATDPTARLVELEADITEGLGLIEQGKAKIWAAVAAVRSEELWQVAGHPSFEAYCEARWGWKKANAHENALAGEVLTGLLESGVPIEALPTSTSAMSQLAKADPDDRPAVLQKAADLNGGRVTEAAVRKALKPEPSPEDGLRSAGIPVYRPTAEHHPSPADSAHATAPPGSDDQSSTEAPAPVLEPSGGSYAPGTRGTLKGCPHSFVVARCQGNSLELWNATERRRVHESEFTPYANQQHSYDLDIIARTWLRDMVEALGPEQVQALLGEVA